MASTEAAQTVQAQGEAVSPSAAGAPDAGPAPSVASAVPSTQEVARLTELSCSVLNLPKFFQQKHLESLLREKGIVTRKVKKPPGIDFARLWFNDAENKAKAFQLLEGLSVKGRALSVRETPHVQQKRLASARPAGGADAAVDDAGTAADAQDEGQQGTTDGEGEGEGDGGDSGRKRVKLDAAADDPAAESAPLKTAADVATPLVPYEEQLVQKRNYLLDRLRRLTRELRQSYAGAALPEWLKQVPAGAPACELERVYPSPVLDAYRNKCEFSFGRDAAGRPCIGFNLGQAKAGRMTVGPVDAVRTVSAGMRAVVAALQRVMEAHPELPPWDRHTHHGFWRAVTVRAPRTGDVMVVVQVNPAGVPADRVAALQDELRRALTDPSATGVPVTSLIWQENTGVSDATPYDAPLTVLAGATHVHEELLGLRFRISPTAFFQVNTAATEVLYELVRQWCAADEDVTVLDVCCGTGTIGLMLAPRVRRVVGIEMVPSAVQDAEHNARLNGLQNVEFRCGKAEAVTKDVVRSLRTQRCIAVVDPPRSGLHPDVCRLLRATAAIDRIVYVSCNADAFVQNAVSLCRPTSKRMAGRPFRVVRAAGVDLFPYTALCELVVLLERLPQHDASAAGSAPATDPDPEPSAAAGAVDEPRVDAV